MEGIDSFDGRDEVSKEERTSASSARMKSKLIVVGEFKSVGSSLVTGYTIELGDPERWVVDDDFEEGVERKSEGIWRWVREVKLARRRGK